jgi:hypothetical protein
MGPSFVRPPVSELVFRLYTRPLHPELFEPLAVRRVDRDGYTLTAAVTRTGHALTWVRGKACLVEVMATADQSLPDFGRRLGHRLNAERTGKCEVAPGIRYQVSSQLEVLQPEQFVHVHEELLADGLRKGLVSHFKPGHRLGLSPLGVVIVEALPHCLSVSAFHTFPDEFAVVKTQSLIEDV